MSELAARCTFAWAHEAGWLGELPIQTAVAAQGVPVSTASSAGPLKCRLSRQGHVLGQGRCQVAGRDDAAVPAQYTMIFGGATNVPSERVLMHDRFL